MNVQLPRVVFQGLFTHKLPVSEAATPYVYVKSAKA